VKEYRNEYASHACVPHSVRAESARRARIAYMQKRRGMEFRQELARLRALPKITGEDLAACFQRVRDCGYEAGYQKGWATGLARKARVNVSHMERKPA
jgi:hypothetical protein